MVVRGYGWHGFNGHWEDGGWYTRGSINGYLHVMRQVHYVSDMTQ